jgi:hypothetical protein
MTRCARCLEREDPTAGTPTSSFALCPEHALAVLEDVRQHLATTLTMLDRATDRASYVVASGAGG